MKLQVNWVMWAWWEMDETKDTRLLVIEWSFLNHEQHSRVVTVAYSQTNGTGFEFMQLEGIMY